MRISWKILLTIILCLLSLSTAASQDSSTMKVKITWDVNTEADMTGYTLYFRRQNMTQWREHSSYLTTQLRVRNGRTGKIFNIWRTGITWEAIVCAYDTTGNISYASAIVSIDTQTEEVWVTSMLEPAWINVETVANCYDLFISASSYTSPKDLYPNLASVCQ